MTPLTVLDLFSGIGGFSLGLERTAGFRTVAFCEIDAFCKRVLAKHWPGVPNLHDVTTATYPHADVITAGFPCQDISGAGARAGLSGTRSGLWREVVRAVRMVRPRYVLLENVADLLGLGMGTVLGDLAASGYDAEWDCIQAAEVGAPHERDRIWIAADPTRVGRGTRRPWGLADGLPGLSDAPRWNPANADCAGLAIRESGAGDAREEQAPAQREADCDVWQSQWPDEPALLGVDDGVSDRVDRVQALGNSLVPQIPEMIGRAIMAAEAAFVREMVA